MGALRPFLWPLGVLALLVACSSAPPGAATTDDVLLEVEPAAVAPGDSVTLILLNGTGDRVGYNLCTSALQRREGGTWRDVPSDRVCTMELRTLAPGETARYSVGLPADLTAGEYRAVTGIERMGPGTRAAVHSDPFRVG